MREEVLRLDSVTYVDQGVTELNHFSLSVCAGEIMGLVPVNSMGLQALIHMLAQNVPIHYGFVYYNDRLVNDWRHSDGSFNRIGVIESRSGLADDLTVADNVFVLRHGFKKHVINRGVLSAQLTPVLDEIGVDILASARARDLSVFQRVVVELVKAVVAGSKLIVLSDVGTVVSDWELKRLRGILRHYADLGISFLYVNQHYEEIHQMCDKAAFMVNGQIVKVLQVGDTAPERIKLAGVDSFTKLISHQHVRHSAVPGVLPALSLNNIWAGGISGLSLDIAPGECVVLHDLDNRAIPELVGAFTRTSRPERGEILVSGARLSRDTARDIAVVQQLAPQTMLFPELNYMDNLCFTLDHRLKKVWRSVRTQDGIRAEYAPWLGSAVFDKELDELTLAEKYDLVYARIMLQRPKVAVCLQPFMKADVELRMHIWRLLEMLLDKRIAVLILAVNLADSLSLADRLVRVQDGKVISTYVRGEFGGLPDSVPWHHLWDAR